ncbi:MAG: hypothetical protein Q9168_003478 [Polycauliona sp. 1 TL-2023]
MSPLGRSEFLAKVIASSTFPDVANLEDHTCYICKEDYLEGAAGETPVKLRCGHALGLNCLTTWVFQEIHQGLENDTLECSLCRKSLRNPESTEEKDINAAVQKLSNWSPGGGPQYDNDKDQEWVVQAWALWIDLCRAIIDQLETSNPSYSIVARIENFLEDAGPAEQFLGFGTVFHFYQAYFHLQWRPDPMICATFPGRYNDLINHLKTASEVGIDEEAWRVRMAYREDCSHQNHLEVFKEWMDHIRAKFSKDIARVRGMEP